MELRFITLVFLCTFKLTFSQENYNYKFTYNFDFKPLRNDSARISENMVLLSGKKTSMFISPIKIILDSVKKAHLKKRLSPYNFLEFKKKYPKNSVTYTIQKRDDKIIYQNKVATKVIEYDQNNPNFNWKIQDKTLNMLGYRCQLATTQYMGRNYEAWFSNEIPIQDGPYKFSGLPGLIFKIYDTEKQFIFTLKSIKKENNTFPELKKGRRVVKTTHKNFSKVAENIFLSFANRLDQASRRKMMTQIKDGKKNANQIELIVN